jgi:hypothetical protein
MKKKQSKMMLEEVQEMSSIEESVPEMDKPELMDFDTWHAIRQGQIPMQHRKEVLKADFRARGLLALATMEQFDQALEKYGVKLDI